jgi:hypothetical protein
MTIKNGEGEANKENQLEVGKDETCQDLQRNPDVKMEPCPDQLSTRRYFSIRPGKGAVLEKKCSLQTDEVDEMEEGVSIRDFILTSLEFLKNCIYFLRYSTKPSMFGMISFLVYLMKKSLPLLVGSYLPVLLSLDFLDTSLNSSIFLSTIF